MCHKTYVLRHILLCWLETDVKGIFLSVVIKVARKPETTGVRRNRPGEPQVDGKLAALEGGGLQALSVNLRVAHGDTLRRLIGEGEAVDAGAAALLRIVAGKDALDDALFRREFLYLIGVLGRKDVEGSLADGVLLKVVDTNAVGGESIVAGFYKSIFRLIRVTRRVVEYCLEGERAGVVVDLLNLAPAQRQDKRQQGA